MSWFEKLMPKRIRVDAAKNKKVIPEGVWEKCQVVIQFYTEKILFKINLFVRIVAII